MVGSYWVTNLFIAVIMDNFVYLTHDVSTLNARHIQAFVANWSKYDKHGCGYITTQGKTLPLASLYRATAFTLSLCTIHYLFICTPIFYNISPILAFMMFLLKYIVKLNVLKIYLLSYILRLGLFLVCS